MKTIGHITLKGGRIPLALISRKKLNGRAPQFIAPLVGTVQTTCG
jgi:hypothetical protein